MNKLTDVLQKSAEDILYYDKEPSVESVIKIVSHSQDGKRVFLKPSIYRRK
jgi:hypothetical protein